jgi:hypothetical protein
MKRNLALFLLLFFISFTQLPAQAVKRKFRGIYAGQIPSYEIQLGGQSWTVDSTKMLIYLDRDSIFTELGNYRYQSSYSSQKRENLIYITFVRDHSGISEELVVDPKNRTMLRKGLYPQPDATLFRKGRLPRR